MPDEKMIDPMQPFLAGALLGMLLKEGKEFMKIVEVYPGEYAPTGFGVLCESGLRLSVKVEVVERPKE